MKKILRNIVILLMISTTSVMGYAGIQYILNTTDTQSVTVGETATYEDGITVTLVQKDARSLTFFTLDETDTQAHYLTYVYDYTVLDGYDVTVSTLSDDIVINDVVDDGQLHITFSLNQEKEFNDGDVLSVQFYFEAVEITLGEFSVTNPLNVNEATYNQLISIGLSDVEANRTIEQRALYTYTDCNTWEIYIQVTEFKTRYQEYEDMGIIVFE